MEDIKEYDKKINAQKMLRKKLHNETGAMLIVSLLILSIVSMLGMAAMETAGLELNMTVNKRTNQAAFAAAELTLFQVQDIYADSLFDNTPLATGNECAAICFEASCQDGYCFAGNNAGSVDNCSLNAAEQEQFARPGLWHENSGQHQVLSVSDDAISRRYIIEFRCYTALDPTAVMDANNYTGLFRITAFASAAGREGVMLRSTVTGSGERISWEILEL